VNFRRLSVIIAELWRSEVTKRYKLSDNFAFFWKTTPYGKIIKILFRKFSSRHRSTRCSNFVKFGRQEIGKIMGCLPDKNWPGSPPVASARISPKICHGQPPSVYLECSRFHQNRFTFGGVIAERVTIAKTRRKMNPIFGWSLPSSRIISSVRRFTELLHLTYRYRELLLRYSIIATNSMSF